MTKDAPINALEEAVRIAGSQSALAKLIGVSQAHVWNWLHRNKNTPPAEYVLAIEKATGVSRHLLRPDIYPVE